MAQSVWREGVEGRQHLYEGGSTAIEGGATGKMTTKQEDNRLLFYALVGLSIYYLGV